MEDTFKYMILSVEKKIVPTCKVATAHYVKLYMVFGLN